MLRACHVYATKKMRSTIETSYCVRFFCIFVFFFLVGWFVCIRGEELQDVQLGLDWSLQGLYIFYRL